MKLALHGATGRVGLALARLCREQPDIEIVGAIAHVADSAVGQDLGMLAGRGPLGVFVGADVQAGLLGADVVIDFSVESAVATLAKAASRAKVAIVSGTTGLSTKAVDALDAASREVPLLWAGNMSFGIQVLSELVEHALRRLGPDFDVEICELHHKHKVDAPSGTAQRLVEAVRSARPATRELSGRSGLVGARTAQETGILSLRGGDVVGDHTVFLLGAGERLELTHRATNRDVFAHGALRAARFLAGKGPGRYTIADVMG